MRRLSVWWRAPPLASRPAATLPVTPISKTPCLSARLQEAASRLQEPPGSPNTNRQEQNRPNPLQTAPNLPKPAPPIRSAATPRTPPSIQWSPPAWSTFEAQTKQPRGGFVALWPCRAAPAPRAGRGGACWRRRRWLFAGCGVPRAARGLRALCAARAAHAQDPLARVVPRTRPDRPCLPGLPRLI
jgi:hypothetical protein